MFKKLFSLFKKVRVKAATFIIKKFIISSEDFLKPKFKIGKMLDNEIDTKFKLKKTGNKEVDKCFSKWMGTHDVKGQFLILFEDAYLVSDWAIPVTKNGDILIETSGRFGQLMGNLVNRSKYIFFPEYRLIFFVLLLKIYKFFKLNLNLKEKINFPLFHMVPRHGYSCSDGPAFSHWVHENLPQVRMFYKALTYNPNIKLYAGKINKKWQYLTLSLLGIKKKKIFDYEKNFLTKVNKLYICRLPFIHSKEMCFDPNGRLWVTKTIRSSLSQKDYIQKITEKNKFKKIAFSRRFCSRRRLLNEDQYSNNLSKRGYEIIYPEKISEKQKISYSYYAKTILGLPSGSALSNFIFSDQPSIIEIQSKKQLIYVWFLLSQELNLKYRLIFADFSDEKSDFRENNFVIDPKDFPNDL